MNIIILVHVSSPISAPYVTWTLGERVTWGHLAEDGITNPA